MDDKRRDNTKEEMSMEELLLMKKIDEDPKLRDLKAPEKLREKVFEAIHEIQNEQIRECLSEEDKELLRLGRIYRKKRKCQKYLVLVAVMVMVLAIGITSVGGAEKVFRIVKRNLLIREQTQVNSEQGVKEIDNLDEEKVYEKIEDEFGFLPVRMMYLPKGVEFQEANIYEEIQEIQLIYGKGKNADIIYTIRPNFREGSWGRDIEDRLIEEYSIDRSRAVIHVKKYGIEDGTVRWVAMFEFQDVSYSLMIFNMEKIEVEDIVQNLYFLNIK